MDKKKIGLIAVLLFLLIGLGTFVFANPDNEEKFEPGDTESREELESKEDEKSDSEETLESDETNETDTQTTVDGGATRNARTTGVTGVRGTNNTGSTNTSETTGGSGNASTGDSVDYYAEALKAVESAESSLKQADVDLAKTAIDKVTDDKQNKELTDRINEVQNIIDVTELLSELEAKTNKATSRDDIESAVDFRNENKIETLVESLKDGEVKENLASRLETVNKILNDNNGPVISGIENDSYTNEKVTITIGDDNEFTVKVTKDGKEVEFGNGEFTEDGTYIITATDKAFNESKITFTIDAVFETPKWVYILNLSDKDNRQVIRNGQTLRIEVNFDEDVTELPTASIGSSQSVVARDCVHRNNGYVCTFDIKIDNSIANLEDGKEIPFTITNIKDKAGNTVTLDNDDVTYTKEYGQVIYDESAPVVKNLGIHNLDTYPDKNVMMYAKNGDTVRVRVYFEEKLGTIPTVKLGGKEYKATYREQSSHPEDNIYAYYADIKITDDMNLKDGIIPFEVYGYTDKVGNEGILLTEANTTEKSYLSVTLDNVKPEVTKVQIINNSNPNSSYIKNGETIRVRATFNEKLGNLPTLTIGDYKATFEKIDDGKGNDLYSADITIKDNETDLEEGKISFIISDYQDLAGNEGKEVTEDSVKTNIIYDRTAPKVKVVKSNNDKSTNKDVIVTLISDEAIYTPEGWTEVETNKGYEFTKTYSANGKYSVVIKDKAGNSTTVNFEVKRTNSNYNKV